MKATSLGGLGPTPGAEDQRETPVRLLVHPQDRHFGHDAACRQLEIGPERARQQWENLACMTKKAI